MLTVVVVCVLVGNLVVSSNADIGVVCVLVDIFGSVKQC